MSGAAITGAFVLAAMGAFFLLSGKHEQFARISVSVGVVGALIFSALQIFPTGDRAARNVAEHQPAAFAAMEGLFKTENGAPLVIIGNPNTDTRKLDSTEAFTLGIYGSIDGTPPSPSTIRGFADQRRAALLSHPDIIKARR